MVKKLRVGGVYCERGESTLIELPLPRLYDATEISVPIKVIRGRNQGPVLLLCAGLHGDELIGIEVIRRLLRHQAIRQLRGSLIAVPIVNIYGFNSRSRYLPDRRDLNRCFPGSRKGSLASRLAYSFMREVVSKATHGIDFHTGAIHRSNLPHIRAHFADKKAKRLAKAFGAPLIIDAPLRDGSLRAAAVERGIPLLVFEGGEALRFDERIIRAGVRGTLSVMTALGMLEKDAAKLPPPVKSVEAASSRWLRAPESGITHMRRKLGAQINDGEVLATITDPLGQRIVEAIADIPGHIIGVNNLPLVNKGDALFHIASFENLDSIQENFSEFEESLD